ncbi:MAG: hypothetical protein AAGD35_03700 [Actinomycetota bacterium]
MVHPISTALFLVGYGLSLPIAARMSAIVRRQHRVAFAGHQIGVVVAMLGWVLSGRLVMAGAHVLWLIGVRLWFAVGAPNKTDAGAETPA